MQFGSWRSRYVNSLTAEHHHGSRSPRCDTPTTYHLTPPPINPEDLWGVQHPFNWPFQTSQTPACRMQTPVNAVEALHQNALLLKNECKSPISVAIMHKMNHTTLYQLSKPGT